MTSLNSPALSASLLNVSSINRLLPKYNLNIDTYELLNAPTDAYSWSNVRRHVSDCVSTVQEDTNNYFSERKSDLGEQPCARPTGAGYATVTPNIISAIESACRAVLKIEKELTEYDTILGDGDCGHTFAAGAAGILSLSVHCRHETHVYVELSFRKYRTGDPVWHV